MTEDLIATQLAKEVRVLCWIMTDPVNHQRKASVVRDTWGKRCNILLFMTTQDGIRDIYKVKTAYKCYNVMSKLQIHLWVILSNCL